MTTDFEFIAAADEVSALLEADKPEPRSLRHPDHAKLIDPIKRRVKRIVAGYFRRQEKAILEDVALRFWHHEMPVREDDSGKTTGERRAAELLPESLSPLNFLTTPKEDSDYLAQIRLAIERAEKQLAAEIDTNATIGENAVTSYLRENSLSKLTGEMSDFTKTRLRNAIANAVDAGGNAEDIVAAIQDTCEDFSAKRAELVAQTEINTAYSWGRHELADTAGMTEKMAVTEGPNPCDDCIDNASEEWIPIDDPFPTGDLFPCFHPGCFCGMSYRLVSAGEGK